MRVSHNMSALYDKNEQFDRVIFDFNKYKKVLRLFATRIKFIKILIAILGCNTKSKKKLWGKKVNKKVTNRDIKHLNAG